jgi:hypothetical protein
MMIAGSPGSGGTIDSLVDTGRDVGLPREIQLGSGSSFEMLGIERL